MEHGKSITIEIGHKDGSGTINFIGDHVDHVFEKLIVNYIRFACIY